ncbi:MAG: hypothetical protein K6T88_14700 [Bacillus sp. (in: Bacteria)]|nr:hypothetical protein [Bacillus sp. (in: firmicutes)]
MKIVKLKLVALIFLLFTGCATDSQKKSELSNNIPIYLEENFGIKDSVNILYAENNVLRGEGNVIFKINKPNPSIIRSGIMNDTMNIAPSLNESVYSELFKGAFIAEHPNVIKATKKIIKDYSLIKEEVGTDIPKEYRDQTYYLYTMFDESQVTELIRKLKQEKTLQTDTILPTLKKIAINEDPLSWRGNINFRFTMDVIKLDKLNKIPRASSIMKSYESARVLPEGNYCINIDSMVVDKTGTTLGYDKRNSAVIFDVDNSGQFHVIKQIDSFE